MPIISQFMSNHMVCNRTNTTGATRGSGSAHPSGAHEIIPGFSRVCVAQSSCLFLGPLYCLSFFYLGFLITLLVSSNFVFYQPS